MTPARTWRSSNGSIILCSSAIRLIQRSALIDGTRALPGRLTPAPEPGHECQDHAHEDRRREREVEREAVPAVREITRQPPERHTERDHGANRRNDEPHDDERLSHEAWSLGPGAWRP